METNVEIYYEDEHYLAALSKERNGKVLVREIHVVGNGYEVYDHTTATVDYLKHLKKVSDTIKADIMGELRNILI